MKCPNCGEDELGPMLYNTDKHSDIACRKCNVMWFRK